MSIEAVLHSIFGPFPPEVLCEQSCVNLYLLYRIFRDVLLFVGITVDRRRRLYIPQDIVNTIYSADSTMRTTATTAIADFKHNSRRTTASTSASQTDASRRDKPETESFWIRVDNDNKRFTEQEKYSGILAGSPNLSEARKAYMMY